MMLLRYLIAAGALALAGGAAPARADMLAAGPFGTPRGLGGALVGDVVGSPRRSTQDSADALYTAGRDAFGRGDFRRAADLLQQVVTRWPNSSHRNEALYWRAYALYRIGGTGDLKAARSSLATLRGADSESYRRDGAALDTRICGALAQRGDEQCAATVAERADSVDIASSVGDVVRAVAAVAADAARTGVEAASNALRDPELQTAIVQAGAAAQDAMREGARATQEALRGAAAGLRDGDRAVRDAQRDMARVSARGARRSSDDCEEDDNDERVIALNALLQMDAERAMPMLKKVMARRDKCSEVLRRKAVFLIAQKHAPDAADLLIDAARNDPDSGVREQSVFWLSRVNADKAAAFLRELALKSGGDVEVRKNALFSLSQMSGGRETLRQVASSDTDAEVREQAIFWLGQRGDTEDVDFLKTLYGRLQNRDLKDKVLFAVSRRRNNAGWLLDVAQDPKESIELRKQALFWAGQGGAPVEQLVSLYDRTTDPEMKKQLVFVYQQRGNGAAFDKLLDIASHEKDKEIRSSAVFWLSRSKDPRALKLIEDIINK